MKCEFCAGDLGIENAFCPHCGKPNKYYEAHRADMENYEERFSKTQEEVTKKAGIFSKKVVYISTVAILLVIIGILSVVLANIRDINNDIENSRNKRNAKETIKVLSKLEDEGKYIEYAQYYSQNTYFGKGEEFKEYFVSVGAALNLDAFVLKISDIVNENYQYTTAYDLAKIINEELSAVYTSVEKGKLRYNNPAYSEKHVKTVENIMNEMHAYLRLYLNMTKEETDSLYEMDDAERFKLLNEKVEKVMKDAK